MRKHPIFYGWWIAISALIVNAILSAPTQGGAGLWVYSLETEFGWTRTQLATAFSLGQLEGSIASPVIGYLIDKIGGKKVAIIGTFITTVGFVVLIQTTPLSSSRDIWYDPAIFYLAYIFMMFGSQMAGWIPMTVIINNWFSKNRSLAMGIGSIGFTAGTFALVPLLAFVITPDRLGWKGTATAIAIIMPMLMVFIWKIIKNKPEEMGLLPDGIPKNPANITKTFNKSDFTIRQALKTKVFWLMSFGHGASAMLTSLMMLHLILALINQGLPLIQASFIWGLAMGIGGISQLIGGAIGDRFEKRYTLVMFGCIQAIAVIVAGFIQSIPLAILFAFLWGIGFGGRAPITTAMRAEYFGRKAFGKIMGISAVPMMMMTVVTPLYAGFMYDSTQDYRYSFITIGIAGFIGTFLFLFAKKPIHPDDREGFPYMPSEKVSK
jgi:MFS family permease